MWAGMCDEHFGRRRYRQDRGMGFISTADRSMSRSKEGIALTALFLLLFQAREPGVHPFVVYPAYR